jgi:hypothetical protein
MQIQPGRTVPLWEQAEQDSKFAQLLRNKNIGIPSPATDVPASFFRLKIYYYSDKFYCFTNLHACAHILSHDHHILFL